MRQSWSRHLSLASAFTAKATIGIKREVSYLRNPEGAATTKSADFIHPVLKVELKTVVVVPMHRNKVNVAPRALVQELAKPIIASIRDSWCTQLGMANKGLHVLPPSVHSLAWCHVGLIWPIRLVEAQKMARSAVVQPVPGIVKPLVSMVALCTPQHGHKLGKGLFLVRGAVPVVLPVDLRLVAQPFAAKLPNWDTIVCRQTPFWPGIGNCYAVQRHSNCSSSKGAHLKIDGTMATKKGNFFQCCFPSRFNCLSERIYLHWGTHYASLILWPNVPRVISFLLVPRLLNSIEAPTALVIAAWKWSIAQKWPVQ